VEQENLISRVRTFPMDENALREPADHVLELTADVVAFASQLCAWMRREDGLGLAATQVEAPTFRRSPALFAMAMGDKDVVFVNPVIMSTEGLDIQKEGCLSFGHAQWPLPAPRVVRVRYTDLGGQHVEQTFRGMSARCVAHEVDHLKGKLMIDRMVRRDRDRFMLAVQAFGRAQRAQGDGDA
jgi:peptide deformylase